MRDVAGVPRVLRRTASGKGMLEQCAATSAAIYVPLHPCSSVNNITFLIQNKKCLDTQSVLLHCVNNGYETLQQYLTAYTAKNT